MKKLLQQYIIDDKKVGKKHNIESLFPDSKDSSVTIMTDNHIWFVMKSVRIERIATKYLKIIGMVTTTFPNDAPNKWLEYYRQEQWTIFLDVKEKENKCQIQK
jgi:hypothetical protein